MLRCCWLGGRKGIRPVKTWVVGCWHGYLSGARCRWPSWCHCHSLSLASVKSRLVLPFWYRLTRVVGSPGKRAIKRVCVLYLLSYKSTENAFLSLFPHDKYKLSCYSASAPAIWLHHHPLHGVDWVCLQILLIGTSRQCDSWSVAGHNHRKVIGWDPICTHIDPL